MIDEPDNLTFRLLRAIDAKLDVIMGDVSELKTRVSLIESSAANLRRDLAAIHGSIAEQSARMDRIDTRLFRIEQRLGDAAMRTG